MEENLKQELEHEDSCKNCGSNYIEQGHSLPLCEECRDILSKRQFPISIRIFLIGLLAIIIISLLNFPKVLNTGITYERGIRFEQQHKYVSAAKEFEKTIEVYPDSAYALCKLYIAYYHNDEIYQAMSVFNKVVGMEIGNEELLNEANAVTARIDELYLPTEEFAKLQEGAANDDLDVYINKILEYSKDNAFNNYAKYALANAYYDIGNYEECRKITEEIIKEFPDSSMGNLLLAAVDRETGDFESAIEYCNKVLEHNTEHYSAIAAKARIELKRYNDEAALKFAQEAYNLKPSDAYTASTLALAYHYNNKLEDRDKLVEQFENGNLQGDYYYNMLKSVFSGAEKWREQ